MPQAIALVDELKRVLREAGITYADVADELQLSEASVKRMFSQRNFSLARLERILSMLRLEFSDLVDRLNAARSYVTQLTLEQEEALVEDPALLLVTFLVVNRWKVDEMLEVYNFSKREVEQKMIVLDRLKILELLPFQRYRLLTARNFSWHRDGPVRKVFTTLIKREFLDSDFVRKDEKLLFLTGSLSSASAAIFADKLDQLIGQFDELVGRDKSLVPKDRKVCSAVLALRPVSYSMFKSYRR